MVAIARRLFLRTLCDSPRPSGHAPSYLSRQRFGSRIWLGPVPAVPPGCPDDASCPPPGLLHEGFTKVPTHRNRPVPLGLKGPDVPGPGAVAPGFRDRVRGPPPAATFLHPSHPPHRGACHTWMARAQALTGQPSGAGSTVRPTPAQVLVHGSKTAA